MDRPMITAAERLQFAVDFTRLDLTALRPGDWLNLRDDFLEFFGVRGHQHADPFKGANLSTVGGIIVSPICFDPAARQEDTPEDFEALQKEVSDILYTLTEPLHIGPLELTRIVPTSLCIRTCFQRVQGKNYLVAEGRTRDLFLFILNDLLLYHADTILRCPECNRIFYRVRKQEYCERACTNRANVRTWRQREEGKQAEAERARKRYDKKRKPAQVKHRPPKARIGDAITPSHS
jgi:hypothetical protein